MAKRRIKIPNGLGAEIRRAFESISSNFSAETRPCELRASVGTANPSVCGLYWYINEYADGTRAFRCNLSGTIWHVYYYGLNGGKYTWVISQSLTRPSGTIEANRYEKLSDDFTADPTGTYDAVGSTYTGSVQVNRSQMDLSRVGD